MGVGTRRPRSDLGSGGHSRWDWSATALRIRSTAGGGRHSRYERCLRGPGCRWGPVFLGWLVVEIMGRELVSLPLLQRGMVVLSQCSKLLFRCRPRLERVLQRAQLVRAPMGLRADPLGTTSAKLAELAEQSTLGTARNLGCPGVSTSTTTTKAGAEASEGRTVSTETRRSGASRTESRATKGAPDSGAPRS